MYPTKTSFQSSSWQGLRPALVGQPRRLIFSRTYRWSSDGNGRRKRESLLDNVETSASTEEEDRVSRLRRRREERRKLIEQSLAGATTPSSSSARPSNPTAEAAGWDPANEWGPAEPIPPENNDYGWAEDSWAQPGRRRNGSSRAAPADFEEWDEEEDGQRERRRSGAAASSSSSFQDRRSAQGRGNGSDSVDYDSEDDLFDEEDGEEDRQYSQRGRKSYRRASSGEPGVGEPDIALLSPQELERVLPVVPFSAQATYFNGGAAQSVQRWGASLALTVLLSKIAVLAAGTLTWPLWWPWAQAATKNYSLRKQSTYAGLWRTQILDVEFKGRPKPDFGNVFAGANGNGAPPPPPPRFSTMRTTRVVLGDPEGAQTEFVLPQDARYDRIQPGQPAELIVLSTSPSFESFKAVKDVYLPDCGLWLSEYPYLDRTEFLELSLEVEREAMMEAQAAEEEGEGYEEEDGAGWDDSGNDDAQFDQADGVRRKTSYGDDEQRDGDYYYRDSPPPPSPPRY